MNFIIFLITLLIALETIFYGIYELKTKRNYFGGISVICISVFMLIFTNIMIVIK